MTASSDKTTNAEGKPERKRRVKWMQVIGVVVSAVASSGITLGAREHFLPQASAEQCAAEIAEVRKHNAETDVRIAVVETKLVALEGRVTAIENAKHEEGQLKVLVQEIRAAWGPGPVRYRSGNRQE